MARQRIIRPDFFTDERLAALQPHARLLFAGLWGLADKRGRLRDQPPVIHGAIFPFEPDIDIDSLLNDLQDAGSILRYSVDGRKHIQVKNFERFQNPHPKEAESTIPAVPDTFAGVPLLSTAQPLLSTDGPGGIRSFIPSVPETVPNPVASPRETRRANGSSPPSKSAAVSVVDHERQELIETRRAISRELALVVELGKGDGQREMARASKTPRGQVIVNPESCSSLPWLRTALERLIARRLELEQQHTDDGTTKSRLAPWERYEPEPGAAK